MKLEIIDYSRKYSLHKASEDYRVDRKSIREWILDEKEYRKAPNKDKRYTLHKGKPAQTAKIEDQIISWTNSRIDEGIAITSFEIIRFACSIPGSPLKTKSQNARQKWCQRFLHRNRYSIRSATHIGQQLPSDAYERIVNFLRRIIKIRSNYNYPLSNIINLDETPVYFDNPSKKAIAHTGAKFVNAKSFKKEKKRISALLTICADGTRLEPFLVFKGKEKKDVYNEVQKHPLVINKSVYAWAQENAWVDSNAFLEYLEQIIFKYKKGQRKLLIMDLSDAHIGKKVRYL
jgi:hypothetical protein